MLFGRAFFGRTGHCRFNCTAWLTLTQTRCNIILIFSDSAPLEICLLKSTKFDTCNSSISGFFANKDIRGSEVLGSSCIWKHLVWSNVTSPNLLATMKLYSLDWLKALLLPRSTAAARTPFHDSPRVWWNRQNWRVVAAHQWGLRRCLSATSVQIQFLGEKKAWEAVSKLYENFEIFQLPFSWHRKRYIVLKKWCFTLAELKLRRPAAFPHRPTIQPHGKPSRST